MKTATSIHTAGTKNVTLYCGTSAVCASGSLCRQVMYSTPYDACMAVVCKAEAMGVAVPNNVIDEFLKRCGASWK